MIKSKQDLKDFILQDSIASNRKSVRAEFLGDEIWKFQILLRKQEYYKTFRGFKKIAYLSVIFWNKLRFHSYSVKLGFSIPCNVFDKGLAIVHYGNIVVNPAAKVGKNCRIHEGVNIGATNGSSVAPVLGDNIFIGTGAKIIGEITIADDVSIGANAVVVKSITEEGTTWGGIPAKKISNNNSHSNLCSRIFE